MSYYFYIELNNRVSNVYISHFYAERRYIPDTFKSNCYLVIYFLRYLKLNY